MSHELRTPLNSIIGYSEVLLDGVDGELNDEMEEDIGAIYNSGKHLLSIINEILDLAKIDAGQMQLNLKELDITELLSHVVKNNEVLLKDRPVEMHLVAEDDIGQAYIDPVRMNQVMLNLVGNAVKFTEEGTITVRYGQFTRDFIYVRVEDTGMGMSEEQLQVIFERFRQVDGSSTRRAGGTGLGLTITKQLIEMHGGSIHVESTEGEGTTFWFTLPTAEAAKPEQSNGRIDIEAPAPQAGD
jgi:signal transduction histidine kinase